MLDTHALLWFLLDDRQLTAAARALIGDPGNEIWISPASYWEIAIKISAGKYALAEPLDEFLERELAVNDMLILPIAPKHAAVVSTLPFYHRDPFDRLIVAQAIVEQMAIASGDPAFDSYGIVRHWQLNLPNLPHEDLEYAHRQRCSAPLRTRRFRRFARRSLPLRHGPAGAGRCRGLSGHNSRHRDRPR